MGRILIGTSSWSDHQHFYPPGTSSNERLAYYASQFPVVEINTSYYHIPGPAMVEGWIRRTPPGFVFDVKPPRALTGTPEIPGAAPPEPDAALAAAFARAIRPLADAAKLGAVTFQFPPSYRNTEEHRDYVRRLPGLMPGFRLSVEFRREDWLDPAHAAATFDLLRDAGLAYTMVDEPQAGVGSVPPVYAVTSPELAIVRFHGRNAANWYNFSRTGGSRFDWTYTHEELAEWIPRIARAATEAAEVHVFFNTNVENQGPENARHLMAALGLAIPPGQLF